MPNQDIFAGIKLSEQVNQTGVEQRLFATPKPALKPSNRKPENQETGKPGNREVGKEEGRETIKESSRPTNTQPVGEARTGLDLEETPTRKDSFLFTQAEFEALEDIKLEFRRKYDKKVTKNELARCAVHLLVEDYQTNQERSFLGRKLLGKQAKR